MSNLINQYPSVADLRKRAEKRTPAFAFEYLDGGCNEDVSLHRNTAEIRAVQLEPRYLRNYGASNTKTTLFGQTYDAPFGIAPVGLQGLMWPNAPEILAKAAHQHNIPFILSTVTTMDIERASELTEGRAWFQLYNPVEDHIRKDIINRAAAAECPVLVLLSDVPTFGYRPRDFRNHLALPPKMTLRNILQVLGKPNWAMQTLKYGIPSFNTLKPYTPEGLNLKQLGAFMDRTFSGKLNAEKIKPIRDQWKGKLVLKGDQIEIMMDSGIRSGPDIARAVASGAKFTFLGRAPMYGVAALGHRGGDHTISILKTQFKQVMDQLCCEHVSDLPKHLIQ
jgi:L-lactate dehydrogenase (cytochrome)